MGRTLGSSDNTDAVIKDQPYMAEENTKTPQSPKTLFSTFWCCSDCVNFRHFANEGTADVWARA